VSAAEPRGTNHGPRDDDPGYSIKPEQAVVNGLHARNILCSYAQGCALALVGDCTFKDGNPVGHDDIDAAAGVPRAVDRCNTGALLGIVTESDLLRRAEAGTEKRHTRWVPFLIGPGRLAQEHVHSHGRKVGEVMTERVFSVTPETRLADATDRPTHFGRKLAHSDALGTPSGRARRKRIHAAPFPEPAVRRCRPAVNAGLPNWSATLRGEASDMYLRWERDLRPHGFRLGARVLEFPDGMPGDIGLFLSWGE